VTGSALDKGEPASASARFPSLHLSIKVLRQPAESAQYTSWIFGHRLRAAGLLGSMGRVASSVDNTMMESFWSTMQRELLDRRHWTTKAQLASAIFEWIEAIYNPIRRHSALGYLSPIEFEALHTAAESAA
jgi:putative transposase